jgi:hypothetical protein
LWLGTDCICICSWVTTNKDKLLFIYLFHIEIFLSIMKPPYITSTQFNIPKSNSFKS